MEVHDVRDWVIVVYGGVGVVATVTVMVLTLLLYSKVAGILDSLQETTDNVRNTSSALYKHVIQPLSKAQGFVAGVKRGIEILSPRGKKSEEGKDE